MSVPVNEGEAHQAQRYAQPVFGTSPLPMGEESVAEEATGTDHLVARAAQPEQPDWLLRISALTVLVAGIVAVSFILNGLGGLMSQVTAWASGSTTYSKPKSQQPAPKCTEGKIYVATNESSVANFYCLDEETYDTFVTQAEAQYAAALKRGKPTYTKWLVAHKLDSVKTETAREKAAQKYVCQSDYGDGALYAATKAGISEYELDIPIGDKIITIDGYDPEDVRCYEGKPVPPPSPPSVQPKDPSQDPNYNGNAGNSGGKNQDSGPGSNVPPPAMSKVPRTNPAPPPEPSRGPVNHDDPLGP